jgi:hypothetical protein
LPGRKDGTRNWAKKTELDTRHTQETFFRPDEVHRERTALPAVIYNHCRRLLTRSESNCVFVPIREMQYVAVVDAEEIIFVDSQTGHMVVDGVGGRPIQLSWRFGAPGARESLSRPVDLTVIHYRESLEEVQRRLIGAFNRALVDLVGKCRDSCVFTEGAKIIPLRNR